MNTPEKLTARSLLRHPLLLSLYLPALLEGLALALLIPVLPLYAAEFGVSYSLIGIVLAGDGLGALLGDVPAGSLTNKLGAKRTILIGLLIVMLAMAALFFAQSIFAVIVLRVLSGIGRAFFGVAQHTYLSAAISIERRGRAIALFGGMNRLSNFIAPVLGGGLGLLLGLRAPFLFAALILLGAIVFVMWTLPADSPDEAERALHPPLSLWATLRDHYRILSVAGIAQIFAQTIRAGRSTIIPLYGADVIGLDVAAIGLIVTLTSFVDLLMVVPAGITMDRFGRKMAIVPCFTIQALGMALIPLTGSFMTLLLAGALIGFGNGLGSGSMMTLGSDLAPLDGRGSFLGIWRLIGDVGFGTAPVVVGSVADSLSLSSSAFVLAGAGVTAGLIFALGVPETLHSKKKHSPVPL